MAEMRNIKIYPNSSRFIVERKKFHHFDASNLFFKFTFAKEETMISLIFNHSSVILIFSKFLLEIFTSLKSFQLIDSFIPWLKLVGATGNEISSWLIQCKLRKKRWKRKPSLSCRDIHPGKEEDEWRGNRSKEVSLSLSLSRRRKIVHSFLSLFGERSLALISHLPCCLSFPFSFLFHRCSKLIQVSIYLTRLPLFKHYQTEKDWASNLINCNSNSSLSPFF